MKEALLKVLSKKDFRDRTIDELADYFNKTDSLEFIELLKIVNELEEAGEIARDSYNRYYLSEDLGYYKGIISINSKGFAFVKINEEREFYIARHDIKDAYNGDKVLIKDKHDYSRGKEEAKVVRVLERGISRYVGEVKQGKRGFFVKVDDPLFNQPIFVDYAHAHGAQVGHKVVVEIKTYKPQLKGDIIKIIGHVNDPGIDILSVVYKHDVEVDFPQEVYDYIASIDNTIDYKDINNRVDVRDEMIITIDGEDAKDLDDAVTLKKLDNGHYQLGVYIADVSYYVEEGSVLDQEAIKRGTSIYLVDRVIPMLPHKLSNGICSLNEGEDRYTIGCVMEIDTNGNVVEYNIIPAIIRSSYRMTYTNVNKILEGDESLCKRYAPIVDMLNDMQELSLILRRKRDLQGSIDFDSDEAKIILDKKGKVKDVVVIDRGNGERLIEEFMLIANETVATHFRWLDVPFIYRVHEYPKEDKLRQFQSIVRPLGYTIRGSLTHLHPSELRDIVEESKDTPEHSIISTLLLRCMQKARYDENCLGHYGLSFDYYTHFTSPIRRYPDLLVHRLIRKYLFEQRFDLVEHYEEIIPDLAQKSSDNERKAIELEREVDDMKMCEYMSYHVGDYYTGIISSITRFGFFVELENTIDGLVHMNDLKDDYYIYDDNSLRLIGERTGKQFKIGDQVRIRVKEVNIKEGNIDFELAKPRRNRRRYSRMKR